MAVQEQKQPQLNISSDGMEAYLRLPVPSLGEPYTEDKILQFLSEKGVCVGIQKEAIKGLLDAGIYERDVRVAVGTKPVDGTDGYYEYEFNSDFSKKPKIREDGTVDYWSMNLIEVVREGQEIAKYHPAVEAKAGVDVKGRPVTGKHGRELPPLKGKGFERSEDNLTYIAMISGKITKQEDRIYRFRGGCCDPRKCVQRCRDQIDRKYYDRRSGGVRSHLCAEGRDPAKRNAWRKQIHDLREGQSVREVCGIYGSGGLRKHRGRRIYGLRGYL